MSLETDKILQKANIALGPNDEVIRNDEKATISIKRAFYVSVEADGNKTSLIFTDGTVGYAIKKANIKLNPNDVINYNITDPLTPDLKIKVTRMYEINVKADGQETAITVPEKTVVEDALKKGNITLGPDDIISVSKIQPVEEGMDIEINRVGYRESTLKEVIPYDIQRMESNELELGKTQIKTEGVNGERTITTRKKTVDGVDVESVTLRDEITKQPVTQVVLIGTKQNTVIDTIKNSVASSKSNNSSATLMGNTLIDEHGNVVSYKSVLTGSCTAYTAPPGALTSTGREAAYGYVAVDPSIIPYGTKLYICSPDGAFVYGYAIAADTGGAMLSGQRLVDLYYPTEDECWQVGVRTLCVYIL